jgi:hypothetical protein
MKICIMCGKPNPPVSMDGPYVCPTCDTGQRPDGEMFSIDDCVSYYRRVAHWQHMAKSATSVQDLEEKTLEFFRVRGTIFDQEGVLDE